MRWRGIFRLARTHIRHADLPVMSVSELLSMRAAEPREITQDLRNGDRAEVGEGGAIVARKRGISELVHGSDRFERLHARIDPDAENPVVRKPFVEGIDATVIAAFGWIPAAVGQAVDTTNSSPPIRATN
ncbi:hypothetical protein [Nocardia sp. NPDC050412]|uniref:hypothetical protein n=1 Tax=Nocardia sp. NPDC050412 TaxID=3364320 RepID=UPI003799B0F5